jgi:hypothetical protein
MRLLDSIILISHELGGDNRCNSDSDCDDIYDRPFGPRKAYSKDWVVNCRRDTQPPYQSLISVFKRLKSKISEDPTADPSKENVRAVRVIWVESPE